MFRPSFIVAAFCLLMAVTEAWPHERVSTTTEALDIEEPDFTTPRTPTLKPELALVPVRVAAEVPVPVAVPGRWVTRAPIPGEKLEPIISAPARPEPKPEPESRGSDTSWHVREDVVEDVVEATVTGAAVSAVVGFLAYLAYPFIQVAPAFG